MNQLEQLGKAAFEYLKAEDKFKSDRYEYIDARNEYINQNAKGVPWEVWEHWLLDSGFQNATSEKYKKSLKSKQELKNAKRRMETKFNQVKRTSTKGII